MQDVSSPEKSPVLLRLFVAGLSARSQGTIEKLRELCGAYLGGRYELEIIDIYQQPELARLNQIIATPTLVKYQPQPKKLLIGDLSHEERFMACLGITS